MSKDLEKSSEKLSELIKKAEDGEEVTAGEAQQVLGTVVDAFRAFTDEVEPYIKRGGQKVREAWSGDGRLVVDPRLWLPVHRPDLLEDKDVKIYISMCSGDFDKYVKKIKRRSTRKIYKFDPTLEEKGLLQELLETGEYNLWDFQLNICKSLQKEYFEYRWMDKWALVSNEMVVLRKCISNYIEETSDKRLFTPEQQEKELSRIFKFLHREVEIEKTTRRVQVTEDGLYGDMDKEHSTETVKFIDTYRKEDAVELLISLSNFVEKLKEETK